MWVARDKNNVLKLFVCKPVRIDNAWYFDGNSLNLFGYIADKFNSLKWEDEPVEVEIVLFEDLKKLQANQKKPRKPVRKKSRCRTCDKMFHCESAVEYEDEFNYDECTGWEDDFSWTR